MFKIIMLNSLLKLLCIVCIFMVLVCCQGTEKDGWFSQEESDAEDWSNFDYKKWLDDIKSKRHPHLKDFSYEILYDYTNEKEGESTKEIVNDSIIITYCKDVWIDCPFEGGLKVREKYLKFTTTSICPPPKKHFVTESALVKFRFVILNKDGYDSKELRFEY